MPHIVIIGGGITGLSAAWEVQKTNNTYTLIESADRWGGKVDSRTLHVDGSRFIVDGGPESFVTRKPEVWELANELGIIDQVTDPGAETKNIFVLDGGKPYPIPLNPLVFFQTPLMTLRGKLRLLAEPFQPARKDRGDESLADFVTRRLGVEALEKFIGPVLGGIYNTDPRQQSIMVSSPIMREMEAESGGLFAAALARMFKPRRKSNVPRFITFKDGAQILADELVKQLTGDLRLNSPAIKIDRGDHGYRILLASGELIHADAVIICALADVAANLLIDLAPEASSDLRTIDHQHIGTISLVYRESDLPQQPIVNGLMIPRREKRSIDAVTFTSRKMPARSAPGYALVRVFLGGGRPNVIEMSDPELVQTVRDELSALLGITAIPIDFTIFRWKRGFPQAPVGHLDRIDQIEAKLPQGIALAGSSYRGIAVPDCIKQGREAVKKVGDDGIKR